MTNSKHTKRALLASVLSVVLCAAMLVGTTFAWFTDSVTSKGNIIASGTLDVAMEWADGKADPKGENTTWTDASTGAIFDYKLWEPGYTVARHIRVTNNGTLALKYQLQIAATGVVGKLAEVIDVYAFDNGKQLNSREDVETGKNLGTLAEVLDGNAETPYENHLSAGESHTVTIALKMQETAGNDYQDQSIGSDFAIKLLATQYTEETDSFDNQYDKNADWPLPPVSQVGSNLDLKEAIGSDGDGRAVLTNDIVIEGTKELLNCSIYIRHPDTFIGSVDNTPKTITSGTGQPAAFRVQGSADGFAGYDTYNIEFSNVILKTRKSGKQYSSTIALEEMGNKSVNIVGGQFESVSHTVNAIVKAEDNSSNATITFTDSLFTVKKLDNGNYCAVIFEDKVSNNNYVFKNCKFQYTDSSGTHVLPLDNSTDLTEAPYKTMFVLGEGSTCQFN